MAIKNIGSFSGGRISIPRFGQSPSSGLSDIIGNLQKREDDKQRQELLDARLASQDAENARRFDIQNARQQEEFNLNKKVKGLQLADLEAERAANKISPKKITEQDVIGIDQGKSLLENYNKFTKAGGTDKQFEEAFNQGFNNLNTAESRAASLSDYSKQLNSVPGLSQLKKQQLLNSFGSSFIPTQEEELQKQLVDSRLKSPTSGSQSYGKNSIQNPAKYIEETGKSVNKVIEDLELPSTTAGQNVADEMRKYGATLARQGYSPSDIGGLVRSGYSTSSSTLGFGGGSPKFTPQPTEGLNRIQVGSQGATSAQAILNDIRGIAPQTAENRFESALARYTANLPKKEAENASASNSNADNAVSIVADSSNQGSSSFKEIDKLSSQKQDILNDESLSAKQRFTKVNELNKKIESETWKDGLISGNSKLLNSLANSTVSPEFNIEKPVTSAINKYIFANQRNVRDIRDNIAVPLGEYLRSNPENSKKIIGAIEGASGLSSIRDYMAIPIGEFLKEQGKNITPAEKRALATSIGGTGQPGDSFNRDINAAKDLYYNARTYLSN
jgi:hypothetical protein